MSFKTFKDAVVSDSIPCRTDIDLKGMLEKIICPTDECEDCPDYSREKGCKQIERIIDVE